jgi:hypothetical protein
MSCDAYFHYGPSPIALIFFFFFYLTILPPDITSGQEP